MWLYYSAIALCIVSSVFYHIVQKSTPQNVNPVVSIFVSYIIAIILCGAVYPFFSGDEKIFSSLKALNWTSYALGFAIFGIELGYLLAYRGGWDISLANMTSAGAVAVILIVFGVAVLHEQFTVTKAVGVFLCLIGISLIK